MFASCSKHSYSDKFLCSELFTVLGLSTFEKQELRDAFRSIDVDESGDIELHEIFALLLQNVHGIDQLQAQKSAELLFNFCDRDLDGKISFEEFHRALLSLAQRRDPRVWPMVIMMLMSGMANGMMVTVMPLLGLELALTHIQYATAVSSTNFSKLCSNVPAGMLVDRHGRRSVAVSGLVVQGSSMALMGCAGSFQPLLLARTGFGLGTSLHVAASTMAVIDLSTPLNRARMLATTQTAFSVGKVLGPAVGGVAVGLFGVVPTLSAMGCCFFTNALFTRAKTCETMAAPTEKKSIVGAWQHLFGQWSSLARDTDLRALLVVNAIFELAHGGAIVTLLPLMLTNDYAFAPAQIGGLFALQAVVAVLGATPAAWLVDRIGAKHVIMPALTTIAAAMSAFPEVNTISQIGSVMMLWSAGATLFASAPTVLAVHFVTEKDRAQTMAMLRTSSDLGVLVGAVAVGVAGSVVGLGVAMQAAASILPVTAAWWFLRVLRKMKK